MPRQNYSRSCRIKPTIAFGFLILTIVTAANAQYKPCNDREATGNLIAGEAVENFKPLRIFDIPSVSIPDEIREKGTYGTVILKVRFLAGGAIGKITVIQGLPDGLTEEAVKAAKAIRFLPARLNGRLTNSAETVEYHFPEPGHCNTVNNVATFKPDTRI
jgi:TonB family protein